MASEASLSAASFAVESQSQSAIMIDEDNAVPTKLNTKAIGDQNNTEDFGDEPSAKKDTDSICSIEEISMESNAQQLDATESVHNIKDVTEEPDAKKPRLDATDSVHDIEDITEPSDAKRPRLDTTDSTHGTEETSGATAATAKKPRLYTKSILRSPEPSIDRQRRNKSTSAAVLLGLVKSRVQKLVTERQDRKTESAGSDAITAPLSSTTSSATSSPKVRTPPGECLCCCYLQRTR